MATPMNRNHSVQASFDGSVNPCSDFMWRDAMVPTVSVPCSEYLCSDSAKLFTAHCLPSTRVPIPR